MESKGLVITNARVYTMEEDRPQVEAVVASGERIVYAGREEGIGELLVSGKEVLDLGGRTVIPGFIDSHVHLLEVAKGFLSVDLGGCNSVEEVLEVVKEEASKRPQGEWLVGYNWDEGRWKEGRYITLEELDSVSPHHPVFLKRICLHLVVVNSLALELARVGRDTDGLCLNPETGRPTGVVQREARKGVEACLNFPPEDLNWALEEAQKKMLSLGVTSLHHLGPDFFFLKKAARENRLFLRTYLCASEDEGPGLEGLQTGQGDPYLRIGAVKLFLDGSLGARSAALLNPYTDESKNRGRLRWEQAQLNSTVAELHRRGWQLALHAIGDRAVLAALEALEEAQKKFPRADHRHRIEHCELLPPGAMERIKGLGLIVSAQPNFLSMWGRPGGMYERRLGPERWREIDPLRIFIKNSIPLAFGSDGMPLGPLYGIWSAVNHPVKENRLSPLEALSCYTKGGAYASFEEYLKGTICPGKLADLVVLSHDPITIQTDAIKDIQVEMVVLNGKVIHSSGQFVQQGREFSINCGC